MFKLPKPYLSFTIAANTTAVGVAKRVNSMRELVTLITAEIVLPKRSDGVVSIGDINQIKKEHMTLFIPARMKKGSNGSRTAADVSTYVALTSDHDRGSVSFDDAVRILGGFVGVVHTSSNHTEKHPKWHGIHIYSRPMKPIEQRRYKRLLKQWGDKPGNHFLGLPKAESSNDLLGLFVGQIPGWPKMKIHSCRSGSFIDQYLDGLVSAGLLDEISEDELSGAGIAGGKLPEDFDFDDDVQLDERVNSTTRQWIENFEGSGHRKPDGAIDRSSVISGVVKDLLRAGYSQVQVASLLTREAYAISVAIAGKAGPKADDRLGLVAYLYRAQMRSASEEVDASRPQNVFKNREELNDEPESPKKAKPELPETASLRKDFYSLMETPQFLYVPAMTFWTAEKLNAKFGNIEGMRPARWLSKNRAIGQMNWFPGQPQLMKDVAINQSGLQIQKGHNVFNLYKAPNSALGANKKGRTHSQLATAAAPWIEHGRKLFPDDWEHLEQWFAHRIQRPYEKINHCLVIGGAPRIGKDLLISPVWTGVGGAPNFQDISPIELFGSFNGWQQGIVLRISEARDMGENSKYAFYERTKTLIAAPPEVLRVNEKNKPERYIPNLIGVLITTNNKTTGLYLPPDDGRHYVAWSKELNTEATQAKCKALFKWYKEEDGIDKVVAYLKSVDLSGFDASGPPKQTEAFWEIAMANEATTDSDMRTVLEHLNFPIALVVDQAIQAAQDLGLRELVTDLRVPKRVYLRFGKSGYSALKNEFASDGKFKFGKDKRIIYASDKVSRKEVLDFAAKLQKTFRPKRPTTLD
ncbi:DUF5906 domain-containing protein [Variovorax dokdonensis]|uniref:DUF5906 domain-containing protein n=2 Tax=Variovorax dokdonensis TaxID=344883 RepID=A0ABT7N7U0_9BURK|nr:primase-helicase family protein [Variovorax dokdonensis]MDM0044002.1 DUF5906 domain-containing protein [Variovorax dokdonensis]